jgi:hypothetical protein
MNILEDFTHDIFGAELQFEGNTNLKKPKTQLAYTKEHLQEYIKCRDDIFYFAENYYKILSLKEGMIIPKLRDYQYDMINSYIKNRFSIILATRQAGKSTSFEIYLCWLILFHNDQRVAVLANKAEQSRDILRKVKEAYELLPMFLTQGIKTWNAGSIKLENGSMVIASSTSSTAIRGKSVSTLIVDERAFIANNNWDAFISSVYPTISSSDKSKVIYVSTFNGLNHFYQDWIKATKGESEFKPLRVDWWQVPGRDEAWKEETISNITIQRFRQEYGNEALGSITTLIEPDVLTGLVSEHNPAMAEPNLFSKLTPRLHRYVKVYEEPKKGHTYVAGVDSAKMTVENAGDALGIQILDITEFPIKQVATIFIKEGISYLQAPDIVYIVGNYYNEATLFIENNEIGQEVANMLHFDLEYENVYFEKGSLPGFRTTKKTKRLGCTNLKLLVENKKLVLNDFDTVSQLSTFIKKKDSYCAESGYQDDLVMALVAGLFVLLAQGLDIELIENSSDLGKKIINSIEEDKVKEEDLPVDIVMSDEYEDKVQGDFDWLN